MECRCLWLEFFILILLRFECHQWNLLFLFAYHLYLAFQHSLYLSFPLSIHLHLLPLILFLLFIFFETPSVCCIVVFPALFLLYGYYNKCSLAILKEEQSSLIGEGKQLEYCGYYKFSQPFFIFWYSIWLHDHSISWHCICSSMWSLKYLKRMFNFIFSAFWLP